MSAKLTAAQIGCGKFAWAQDIPNLLDHPDVSLKWLCDIDREGAQRAARHFGVGRATDRIEEIVADPEVDFIKVATSHDAHLPIVRAAAAAGKHVFCEKPMALDDAEGYRIIEIVRRSGIKFCVDLNRRMAPAMQALRSHYLDQSAHPRHNPWRYIEKGWRDVLPEENDPHLIVRIQDESSSYSTIHMNPLKGGGLIIGESVHWLDLACWFFSPAVPVEITAWGSSRFSHGIHLKFDTGASMTLDFSCGGTFDYPKEQYEVTHNAALFRSLFFVENDYYGIPDCASEYFPLQYGPAVKGLDDYLAAYRARVKGCDNLKKIENSAPLFPDKGHRAMLDGFVQAILHDGPTPCTELDGFRATYLANRAIESLELGRTLSISQARITPVF
ncbi:MAG: Gfo/Idh/MocA family oxidoreductase [Victivallaceae bacterium]|nr:Gfo/Idh/MocA family oxidoreductase [Victivallaceae bacterium]